MKSRFLRFFRLLSETRSFFKSRPDIYVVFDENSLNDVLLEGVYDKDRLLSYVQKFDRIDSSYIFVLRRRSEHFLQESDYLRVSRDLLDLFYKLRFTEFWVDASFVMKYSPLVNHFLYNFFSQMQGIFKRRLYVIVLCFSFRDFVEILEKSDVSKYFHIRYYVSCEDFSITEQVEKIKEYMTSFENISLSFDFSLEYALSNGLSYFFSFLREVSDFYRDIKREKAGKVSITTLDYLFGSRACQCFSGDCLTNTITFAGDGRIYLCAKAGFYNLLDTCIGNVFQIDVSPEQFVKFVLLNDRRQLLKDKQESKFCDCSYWSLCHRGCNLFDFKYDGCLEFFRSVKIQ